MKENLTGNLRPGIESENARRTCALPRPRLADDCKHLAPTRRERHAPDCLYGASLRREGNVQIVDLQNSQSRLLSVLRWTTDSKVTIALNQGRLSVELILRGPGPFSIRLVAVRQGRRRNLSFSDRHVKYVAVARRVRLSNDCSSRAWLRPGPADRYACRLEVHPSSPPTTADGATSTEPAIR
jgi:hypothetical protein